MRRWGVVGIIALGIAGVAVAQARSPRTTFRDLTVQQLRVSIPRVWTVIAHGVGTGQPTVSATGPQGKGLAAREQIQINVALAREEVFPDQSLWPQATNTVAGVVEATDPYSAQWGTRSGEHFTRTRTLRAVNDSEYQVTLSGPTTDASRLREIWQAIRWPKVLNATIAVHRFLANHHRLPYWLNAQDGWLLVGGEGDMGSMPMYLYRTTTGGKSWSYAAPTASNQPFPTATSTYGGPAIAFHTPMQGWLAQIDYSGNFVDLYTTADGGQQWRLPRQIRLPDASLSGFPTATAPVISAVTFHLPDLLYTYAYAWHRGPHGMTRTTGTKRIVLY